MESKVSAEFEENKNDSKVLGVDNYQVLLEYGVDLQTDLINSKSSSAYPEMEPQYTL
jgi:hypothetical protein